MRLWLVGPATSTAKVQIDAHPAFNRPINDGTQPDISQTQPSRIDNTFECVLRTQCKSGSVP